MRGQGQGPGVKGQGLRLGLVTHHYPHAFEMLLARCSSKVFGQCGSLNSFGYNDFKCFLREPISNPFVQKAFQMLLFQLF